jgi:hypothetical protein
MDEFFFNFLICKSGVTLFLIRANLVLSFSFSTSCMDERWGDLDLTKEPQLDEFLGFVIDERHG